MCQLPQQLSYKLRLLLLLPLPRFALLPCAALCCMQLGQLLQGCKCCCC